ncbi:MAG: hypothetical protein WEE03_06940 [Chloroflexota bacterium]
MRRVAAAAAIVGGLIWCATVLITALRPAGYAGSYRSTLDLHPTILVAFALIALAATILASDLQPSRLAWVATGICWIGLALLSVNVAFVIATGDDAPVWPTHYGAFFAMALGLAFLGIAALRCRAIRAVAGILMIVPPLVMPAGNMQDDRVLLWLPLGAAALALGTVLVRRSAVSPAR